MSVSNRVRAAVVAALSGLAAEGKLGERGPAAVGAVDFVVERPKRPEHGDFATNVAMVLTKRVGMPPRAIAELLAARLAGGDVVRAAELAGPGFVNLRVTPAPFHEALVEILAAGKTYGRAPAASGERIDLEFVSSNPTGPLVVASARNAVLGDATARVLESRGHRVTREYYINDFGNQVGLFADSVRAVHEGRELGEDLYKGAYIHDIAQYLAANRPGVLAEGRVELSRACVSLMLRGVPGVPTMPGIRKTLAALGVHFDVWFSEESLHRWGAVDAALETLRAGGYLVDKDGATFFRNEDAGSTDDKERVVKKSDGAYTYFASDIAYFADKVARGYDRLLIVLGVDHHGYVARIRNALDALGLPADRFEALLYQLVYILRDGEVVKSSKRAGNIVTADEVMDEIDEAAGRVGAGSDALRFFFLSRSHSSQVDFDIELAKKKSLDNPVFYVQYGHARLCSILKRAEEQGLTPPTRVTREELAKLVHPDEFALTAKVSELGAVLEDAARHREPHRVLFYVQELARDFQSYFSRLKAENDTILPQASVRAVAGWEERWDHDKTRARLAWIVAVRYVYAEALAVLGISAPERMDRPAIDPNRDLTSASDELEDHD